MPFDQASLLEGRSIMSALANVLVRAADGKPSPSSTDNTTDVAAMVAEIRRADMEQQRTLCCDDGGGGGGHGRQKQCAQVETAPLPYQPPPLLPPRPSHDVEEPAESPVHAEFLCKLEDVMSADSASAVDGTSNGRPEGRRDHDGRSHSPPTVAGGETDMGTRGSTDAPSSLSPTLRMLRGETASGAVQTPGTPLQRAVARLRKENPHMGMKKMTAELRRKRGLRNIKVKDIREAM